MGLILLALGFSATLALALPIILVAFVDEPLKVRDPLFAFLQCVLAFLQCVLEVLLLELCPLGTVQLFRPVGLLAFVVVVVVPLFFVVLVLRRLRWLLIVLFMVRSWRCRRLGVLCRRR